MKYFVTIEFEDVIAENAREAALTAYANLQGGIVLIKVHDGSEEIEVEVEDGKVNYTIPSDEAEESA